MSDTKTVHGAAALHKNYDQFDLLKFILSFMVVAVHTMFLRDTLMPWMRIAVPLFFMMTSYLFFEKMNQLPTDAEQLEALKKFCIRNLQLYLFWFIFSLPTTIYIRYENWYAHGILGSMLHMVRGFLFSSTFVASWYIIASVIGVAGVWWLSRHVKTGWLIVLFVLMNLFCCMASSYKPMVGEHHRLVAVVDFYIKYFCTPYNSFPVAFIWVLIGKMFADRTLQIKTLPAIIVIILGAAGLLLEQRMMISQYHYAEGAYNNDCFVSLLALCPPIFALVLKCDIKLKCASFLRKSSTITFALHGTFVELMWKQFKLQDILPHPELTEFAIAMAGCLIIGGLIIWLERFKPFRWLRFAR